jgi:hypothetical protein
MRKPYHRSHGFTGGMSAIAVLVTLAAVLAVAIVIWDNGARRALPAPAVAARPAEVVVPRPLFRAQAGTTEESLSLTRAELLGICQRNDPHFNHLKLTNKGRGLFCEHDLYTRYTLSSGQLARDLQAFISEWQSELKRHRIDRIGVWSTGPYADGTWYKVP